MPTYEYACSACSHEFEVFQAFTDSSLTHCPECGGELKKVYSAVGVVFKGSGFYKTDSQSSNKSASAPAASAPSGSAAPSASTAAAAPATSSGSPSSSPNNSPNNSSSTSTGAVPCTSSGSSQSKSKGE